MTIHLPKRVGRAVTRAFSASVSVMTILTLSGLGSVLPAMVAKAATLKDGDLIRASGDIDVYIVKLVGAKKFKRLILSPAVFNHYRHLKWSNVKTVTAAERDSYTTSNLVRADGDTKVYLLSPAGDVGTKQWITTGEYFVSRGYDWDAVYTINTFDRDSYTTGADLGPAAPAPGAVAPTTPGVVGSLTVSLAADTPAAALAVQNAARLGFTKVIFTVTGGDVTVDSVTVERTGPSADANFSDIALVDLNTTDLIGTAKSLSATHEAVFNDDFVVKGGTSLPVMIAGNMAGTLNGGELAALKLKTVLTKGGASVTGTPVTGNSMTMNSTLTIGTATVAAGGLVPAASTQRVGTKAYTYTSARITAGSAEDIEIQTLRWFQNGTASDSDVANLELYDASAGTVYATQAKPDAKFLSMKFSTPIVIKKGENKEFALRGDILSGSSRTIDWVIDKSTDLIVKGKTYGYFLTPSYPNSTDPRFNPSDTTTVGAGTLTVSKAAVPSLNIASGATQQVVGKFNFNVQGEPVRVTRLVFYATTSGSINVTNLTSLTLYDSSGNVVAGPVDPTVFSGQTTQGRATTTDTVTVPVGATNEYTLKGNLTTSFTHNSTIQMGLISPNNQITARGDVTNVSVTPSPSADLLADTVTVKAGALRVSLSATPAAQNVIAGASDFTFANIVIDASDSGEDVRVNTIRVKDTAGTANTEDDIINQKVFDGSTLLQTAQPTEGTATTSFTLTTPLLIPKGTSKTITHKGTVVTSATATQTHAFGISGQQMVVATGAATGASITPTLTDATGQTMTVQTTGTLTVATDAANPLSALATAGQNGVTVGIIRFTATGEDINLTSLHVTTTRQNTAALTSQVAKFHLLDGIAEVAFQVPTQTEASVPVTFIVPANPGFKIPVGSTGKALTITADFNGIGTGLAGVSGNGFSSSVAEDAYGATGVSSGTAVAAASKSGTYTGNTFTLYKSTPTVSFPSPLAGDVPGAGTVALFRFTVAAPASGDVGIYKFSFAISTTSATVADFQLFETPGASEVNLYNNAVRQVDRIYIDGGTTGRGGVYGVNASSSLFSTGTGGVANGGDYRLISAGGSKTYELRGTFKNGHELDPSGRPISQVVVNLLGDKAFPTLTFPNAADRASAGATAGVANRDDSRDIDFIWSDLNVGNNSSTATQTREWTNGFRVPGLNPNSSTDQILK